MTDNTNLQSLEAALSLPQDGSAPATPTTVESTISQIGKGFGSPGFGGAADLTPSPGNDPLSDVLSVLDAKSPTSLRFDNPAMQKSYDNILGVLHRAVGAARQRIAGAGAAMPSAPAQGDALSLLARSVAGSAAQDRPAASVAPVSLAAAAPIAPPLAPLQLTEAPSFFSRGKSFGYDYNGIRVSLPADIDRNDQNAVRQYANFTNQLIDWMHEYEEEA